MDGWEGTLNSSRGLVAEELSFWVSTQAFSPKVALRPDDCDTDSDRPV